jgi:hypothetical protein
MVLGAFLLERPIEDAVYNWDVCGGIGALLYACSDLGIFATLKLLVFWFFGAFFLWAGARLLWRAKLR